MLTAWRHHGSLHDCDELGGKWGLAWLSRDIIYGDEYTLKP